MNFQLDVMGGTRHGDDLGTILKLCLSGEKRISHTEPLMGLQSVGGIVRVCLRVRSPSQSGLADATQFSLGTLRTKLLTALYLPGTQK